MQEWEWKATFILETSTQWNVTVTGWDEFMNKYELTIQENGIGVVEKRTWIKIGW